MTRRKSVLIVHHFGGIGGGTTSAIDIARMFKALSYDVVLGIHEPSSDVRRLIHTAGINYTDNIPRIIEFNYHNATRGQVKAFVKYISSYRYQKAWRRYLETNNVDILVLNSVIQSPLAEVAQKMGIKCMCFVRETICGSPNSVANIVLRRFLEKNTAVVFLTEYDKKNWCLPNNLKTFVLPDIVDINRFELINVLDDNKPLIKNNSTLHILYLGGFSYSKGITDILRAIQIATEKNVDVELFILGDHFDRFLTLKWPMSFLHRRDIRCIEESDRIISDVNKNKQVIYKIGPVSNPYEWYKIADVVVFPVKEVHQARPVYEAGYLSIPVILPRYPNFNEAMKENVNGLYYNPNDYVDLCNRIIEMRNESLRKRLGLKNRCMTNANHTFSVGLHILESILNEIILS